jgi:hypothetical protein
VRVQWGSKANPVTMLDDKIYSLLQPCLKDLVHWTFGSMPSLLLLLVHCQIQRHSHFHWLPSLKMKEDPHLYAPYMLLPFSRPTKSCFDILFLWLGIFFTCSNSSIWEGQQMAISLELGALKFSLAEVKCPKAVSTTTNLIPWHFSLVYIFQNGYLLSCFWSSISKLIPTMAIPLPTYGAVTTIIKRGGGGTPTMPFFPFPLSNNP